MRARRCEARCDRAFFMFCCMKPQTVIRAERADHPQVVAMLAALDAYLVALYEPEASHGLSLLFEKRLAAAT